MINILLIAIMALLLGLAVGYIYKEKKKGSKCIGCPCSGACHSKGNCQGAE